MTTRRNALDYLACLSCGNSNMYIIETTDVTGNCVSNQTRNERVGSIKEGFVICPDCLKQYPVLAGIPVMLADVGTDVDAIELFEASTEHLDYSLEPTKKVAQLLHDHRVETALDVACGLGSYTHHFRCNNLVSFDFSPYFVKKCFEREGSREGKHWLVADVKNMPLKEQTFDLIFASSILEHLEFHEAKQVIARFDSLLREGGLIQIDVPNCSRLQDWIRKFMTIMTFYKKTEFEEHPELGHHCLFTRKDLKKLGFEVHGCIGWVTRQKLPISILWELYDLIGWYMPSLAGTLIGLRKAI